MAGEGRPAAVIPLCNKRLQTRRMSPALQVMHRKADFGGDVCIDRSLVASDVYASNSYKIDWRNTELTF